MKQPANVRLVEDNNFQVQLIKTVISRIPEIDFVSVVEDGEQALAYLQREPPYDQAVAPDLVLLDINMPRKDGFELLGDIKADAPLRRLPVVMLTTNENQTDVDRAYETGAAGYITKPVLYDELEKVLERFAEYWTNAVELPSQVFSISH